MDDSRGWGWLDRRPVWDEQPVEDEEHVEPIRWPGKLTRTMQLAASSVVPSAGAIQRAVAALQRQVRGRRARRYRLPLQLVSFGPRPPQAAAQLAHATRVYGELGITIEPVSLTLPPAPARRGGELADHVLDRDEQQWHNADDTRPHRALDQGLREHMEDGRVVPPRASQELLELLHRRVQRGQIAVYWIPTGIRDSPAHRDAEVDAMTYDRSYFHNIRADEEGIVLTPAAGTDVLTHELGHILMRMGHNDQSTAEERADPDMDDRSPDPNNVMTRGGLRRGSQFTPAQLRRLYDSSYLIALDPPAAPAGPTQRAVAEESTPGMAPDQVRTVAEHGVSGASGRLPFVDAICASFGHHDVSEVRAAIGGPAADAAGALGAHAYATGETVAFAGVPSLFLAAHEAAHVVQQRRGVQLADGIGRAGDRYEQHADAVADAVVRGESAEALLDEGPGATRTSGRPPPAARAPHRRSLQPAVQLHPGDHRHPHGEVRDHYPWLRDIATACGAMTNAVADRWIDGLTLEQVMVIMAPPVDPSPAAGPARGRPGDGRDQPPAPIEHTGGHARSRPVDWGRPAEDQPHGGAQLHANHPAGRGSGSSLGSDFRGHREAELHRTFGATATIEQVQQTIRVAEQTGQQAAADRMRGLLFRCNQYAVVDSLDVEHSQRYQANHRGTFCNVYAHDVVTALGAYLPRVWWTEPALREIEAGHPPASAVLRGPGRNVSELSGDRLNWWLRTWGPRYGWELVADAQAAQDEANAGHIVVASAQGVGDSGHINVVMAEDRGRPIDDGDQREEAPRREAHRSDGRVDAPLASQAGSRNYDYSTRYDRQGTGDAYYDDTQWWSDEHHRNGGFYVWRGGSQSPIATPEELGWRPDPGPAPGAPAR